MEGLMQTDTSGEIVTFEMTARYNEKDGHIHLVALGKEGFITTVNNNTENDRGHPDLFIKLARLLQQAGVPHPHNADE